MGIPSAALRISCRENGVNKHKSADDLRPKAVALGVAGVNDVSAAALRHVKRLSEPFHHAGAADGPQTLHHHVEHRSS